MAKKTKRPIAAFLLPKAPKEKPFPKDFRMLPDIQDKFDKKTIFAIRRSRNLQKISAELAANLNDESRARIKKASLDDKPTEVAAKYRYKFELTEEKQIKFKDAYKFYHFLRDIFENHNILSFQM